MTTLQNAPTTTSRNPYNRDEATQPGSRDERQGQPQQATQTETRQQSDDNERTFTITADDWMMG